MRLRQRTEAGSTGELTSFQSWQVCPLVDVLKHGDDESTIVRLFIRWFMLM